MQDQQPDLWDADVAATWLGKVLHYSGLNKDVARRYWITAEELCRGHQPFASRLNCRQFEGSCAGRNN
jgi:hypothetical protein